MSDQGEKTCPLCAEEMDLTDQQLKPCKCGYDICVWCWHHIMDMAERDGTEGRCPACRTPYNKEKIVGTTAKCERLVAEMSMEKKTKSKSKSKTSDGRKQLSSVRVIQRNLVYIVGLPLNLADEDLLQGKEYFARYGKVLKVSISRTALGAIQLSANNTCSVYITYSKEEEAVRCIQSVHGYSLEGRPLRACFGTTKYCHAWLRNAPCTNPDCLYLHEIGSHEDSFTKDEIVSAYTRSRMQQIASGSFDMQQRSGDVLPPPADDYCNDSYSSSGNPINKIATDNTDVQSDNILSASVWHTPASSVRGSSPSSRSSRVGLPAAAAWGMSASNSQLPHASVAILNGSSKEKADTCNVSLAISTGFAHAGNPTQASTLHSDLGKKASEANVIISPKAKLQLSKSDKIDRGVASDTPAMSTQLSTKPSKDKTESSNMLDSIVNSFDNFDQSRGGGPKREVKVAVESEIPKVCSDLPSLHTDEQRLQECSTKQYRDIPSTGGLKGVTCSVSGKHFELRSDAPMQVAERANCEVEDDLRSFNVQRIKDTKVDSRPSYMPSLSQSFNFSDISRVLPPHDYDSDHVVDPLIVHNQRVDKGSVQEAYSMPLISNEYRGNEADTRFTKLDSNNNNSYMLPNRGKHADDVGESSIISNILSMNFDSWDESLASPHDLVKMLGEGDKQQRPIGVSNSWKLQTSGQSRFSFAREDDAVLKFEQSFSNHDPTFKNHNTSENGFTSSRDFYLDKSNGSPAFSYEDPDNFASIHSFNSHSFSVSRATGSAPPGFSGPKRAPPPGFTTHERMTDPILDIHSENPYPFHDAGSHSFEAYSPSIKPYQAPPPMNMGSAADIEFMDPAILAVGKGRLPTGLQSPGLDMRSVVPPQQVRSYANDAQLQLLMQRSLIPQKNQNQRYIETGGNISAYPDPYGIPSRMMEQTVADNLSPLTQYSRTRSRNQLISNGNWNSWNEVQRGNELSMAELLRTEQLGIDKLFNGYEDSKYRIPNSTDMYNYNRTYGI